MNKYQILSAAQCFQKPNYDLAENWIVLAGTNSIKVPKGTKFRRWKGMKDLVRKVKKIIVHQEFIPSMLMNDIAILNLYRPFKLHGRIQKAVLEDKYHNPEEIKCYLAGWGSVLNDENCVTKYPDLLCEVTVTIRNLAICKNQHLKANLDYFNITTTTSITNQPFLVPLVYDKMNICAGSGGKDSCTVLKRFNFSFENFNLIS